VLNLTTMMHPMASADQNVKIIKSLISTHSHASAFLDSMISMAIVVDAKLLQSTMPKPKDVIAFKATLSTMEIVSLLLVLQCLQLPSPSHQASVV